jgi:hypothetical protein
MQIKPFRVFVASSLIGLALAGCSGGGDDMSKAQQDALKNPDKTINAQAAAGMSKQGELEKKQLDANAAAGVDARGVPLSKSNLNGASGPGGTK